MDFFELGQDENLIRRDKMNTEALPPNRRDEYKDRVERLGNHSAANLNRQDNVNANAYLLSPQTTSINDRDNSNNANNGQ